MVDIHKPSYLGNFDWIISTTDIFGFEIHNNIGFDFWAGFGVLVSRKQIFRTSSRKYDFSINFSHARKSGASNAES